ncbi:hypothetical protein PAA26_03445 [Methanomassiliicoccaceae archaeon COG_1]|nr:hypothetical protein [Methanomassiliicoccaceae archaeon COG_1]
MPNTRPSLGRHPAITSFEKSKRTPSSPSMLSLRTPEPSTSPTTAPAHPTSAKMSITLWDIAGSQE